MKTDTENLATDVSIARIIAGAAITLLVVAAVLLGDAIAARPAAAQQAQIAWIDRAEVVEQLAARYTEAPTALGLTSDGAVIELFTTGDGATWTIVITLPNGLSRVVATGESWTRRPLLVKGRTS